MKKLVIISIFFSFATWGISQCIPDTNCIDINEPGQICPDSLPAGQQGVAYSQVFTIIAPDSADVGGLLIGLNKIQIDTVTNLPPGLSYYNENNDFFPDSIYCIEISGTPSAMGIFHLKISVIPFINSDILGLVALPAQTDSTSVYITIEAPSSVVSPHKNSFRLLSGMPNPFQTETRIGASTPSTGPLRLMVYSITGKLIYDEHKQAVTGKNIFSFRGNELSPGIYFYTVTFNHLKQSGKLMKIE